MNKKLFYTTIITMIFIFFTGCTKVTSNNTTQKNSEASTITVTDSTDNSQYIKKTWFTKSRSNNDVAFSIYISKIVNGDITGKISINGLIVTNSYYFPDEDDKLGNLTGTINNGIVNVNLMIKRGIKGDRTAF